MTHATDRSPLRIPAFAVVSLLVLSAPLHAQSRAVPGPMIHSAGAVFEIERPTFATPTDMEFKVVFELAAASSDPARLNPSINTVARYLNMHAQAGVPRERIRAAIVAHGPASWELVDDAAYREEHGTANPNATLIRELIESGVRVVLCGQSAASRGVPRDHLIDGVELALSAMTAFVVLQEEGYHANPW